MAFDLLTFDDNIPADSLDNTCDAAALDSAAPIPRDNLLDDDVLDNVLDLLALFNNGEAK